MSAKLYSLKLIGLIICLALSFMTAQSSFACQLESTGAPTAPRIDYDVYAFDRAIASTTLELRNAGDTECVLDIVIEDLANFPPPFTFPTAGVAIDVIAPGLQRPQSAQNRQGIFELTLPPSSSEEVKLDFFTDQNLSVPSGLYNKDIEISVRHSGGVEPLLDHIINLSLSSTSQAQINIAGADGTFNKNTYMDAIDFGEAEIGQSRRVFIQSRSNAMATMTIRSDNGGVMKHADRGDATIGYKAVFDNQEIDLQSPYVIPNLSSTNLDGSSQALDLTIESLNTPYAGQYSDRIVIEIEAR